MNPINSRPDDPINSRPEDPIEAARMLILSRLTVQTSTEDRRTTIANCIKTALEHGVYNEQTMKQLIINATKDASSDDNIDALAQLLAERVTPKRRTFCRCWSTR